MATIISQYEIDADRAIATVNRLQQSYLRYNAAVGQMATQTASYNKVGGNAKVVFTQIDQAGRKVNTTIREAGSSYEVLSTKLSKATDKQRLMAAEMEKQRQLADKMARAVAGSVGGAALTPTAITGAPSQSLIAKNIVEFSLLSKAQLEAAASANFLNATQRRALLDMHAGTTRVTKGFNAIGNAVAALDEKLLVTGKIAFQTAIYRAISAITQALQDGAQEALEYSRQIGLIQTLSQQSGETFDTWSESIRAVADEFGRPATEIAAATYDALSNQIIETTADMDKVRVAAELARNTNSNTADSVNVLSSVMNSFGSSAGSARVIADQLFTTVDLGRVRINELNTVIGRSGNILRTAGISLTELNAGMIVLTQTGLDSAEAATLLNNIANQLIKPNEALAAQFKKMGFESGRMAVETLGLVGVMRELHAASRTASEGIATFFPEIRGLRGAAAFAGEGLDKLEESMRALERSAGANEKATEILNANVGQQLLDEMERIKTFFTVDIGIKALEIVAKLTQRFGGLNEIVQELVHILLEVGHYIASSLGFAAGVAGLKIVSDLVFGFQRLAAAGTLAQAATNFGSMAVGLLTFNGVLTLATIAYYAFGAAAGYAAGRNRAAIDTIIEHEKKAAIEIRDERTKLTDQITADLNKAIDTATKSYGKFIADFKKHNNSARESSGELGKSISGELKNNFQVMLQIAASGLSKLEGMQRKASSNIEKIAKDKTDMLESLDKKQFDRQLNRQEELLNSDIASGFKDYTANIKNPTKEILKLVNARNDLLREKQQIAFDTGDIEAAKGFLDEILQNLDKLGDMKDVNRIDPLDRTKSGRRYRNIDRAAQSELDNYNVSAADYVRLQEEQTVAVAKQVIAEKERGKTLEDLLSKTSTFVSKGIFDKEGNLLEKYIGNPDAARKDLVTLQNEAIKMASTLGEALDPLTAIQYNAALKEIEENFAKQRQNLAEQTTLATQGAAATEAARVRSELAEKTKKEAADLTIELGKQRETIEQMNSGLRITLNTFSELSGKGQSETASRSSFGVLFGLYENLTQNFSKADQTKIEGMVDNINHLMSTDPAGNVGQAKEYVNELIKMAQINVPNLVVPDKESEEGFITFINLLHRANGELDQIALKGKDITPNETKLENMTTAIAQDAAALAVKLENANPQLGTLITNIKDLNDQTAGGQLDKVAQGFKNLAESIEATAKASAGLGKFLIPQVPTATGTPGQPPGFADGGMVNMGNLYNFLTGKYAKGSDVIPAMLGRKEFVVREPMAQKYYSQLVAMNAGHFPIYRAAGGPVSNTNVGDIHFTIQGGKTTPAMAREVASHIRRGIKQGTLKI